MVQPDKDQQLDDVILQIFEQSGSERCSRHFFFPVTTQREAREFVKELSSRGVQYSAICDAVSEFENNFTSWRTGLGRAGIGNRVIERINRPVQQLLLADDDDNVDDDVDVSLVDVEEDDDVLSQFSTSLPPSSLKPSSVKPSSLKPSSMKPSSMKLVRNGEVEMSVCGVELKREKDLEIIQSEASVSSAVNSTSDTAIVTACVTSERAADSPQQSSRDIDPHLAADLQHEQTQVVVDSDDVVEQRNNVENETQLVTNESLVETEPARDVSTDETISKLENTITSSETVREEKIEVREKKYVEKMEKDKEHNDEGHKDEGQKDEGHKNEGQKNKEHIDEGHKDEGQKDEEYQHEKQQDEGQKDEGEKDEGEMLGRRQSRQRQDSWVTELSVNLRTDTSESTTDHRHIAVLPAGQITPTSTDSSTSSLSPFTHSPTTATTTTTNNWPPATAIPENNGHVISQPETRIPADISDSDIANPAVLDSVTVQDKPEMTSESDRKCFDEVLRKPKDDEMSDVSVGGDDDDDEVDENYDSDDEDEMSLSSDGTRRGGRRRRRKDASKRWGRQYGDDGPGFLYAFTDTTSECAVSCRVKVSASRQPHSRLRQASLFNVDIRLVSAVPVSCRLAAAYSARQRLAEYRLAPTGDWFTAPLEVVINVLMDVARIFAPADQTVHDD